MTSPLYSNSGRIFIRLPGEDYKYYGNAKLAGISKSFGESAPVYGQDRTRAGRFEIIDRIPNTEENFWTTSLTGHMDRANSSKLALAADNRCAVDIQVHYGTCNDPTDFTDYESTVILENCRISQYQTTDLVALEPKDTAVIQETINISATVATRLVKRNISLSGLTVNGGVVADICAYRTSCAVGCDINGCGRIYVLKVITLGGAPFAIGVGWSDDDGITFHQVVIDYSVTAASGTVYRTFHIEATKDYILIFIPHDSLGYEILAVPHASFIASASSLTPSLVATGADNDAIYTTFAAGGSVYYGGYNNVFGKVTNQLTDTEVYAIADANHTFYGGAAIDADNMILFPYRETTTIASQLVKVNAGPFVLSQMDTAVTGIGSSYSTEYTDGNFKVYAAAMIDKSTWLIGNNLGDVLKTTDGGVTWEITRSFFAPVVSIKMATPSIGYLATSYPAGVWRTVDAGETWAAVNPNSSWPADVTGDRLGLISLHVCSDPNTFFVAGGHGSSGDVYSPNHSDGGISVTSVLGYGAE